MCVCVFWRSLCSKFLNWETILKDFCVDWIIGWVVCWIAFISVFFFSKKKLFWKAGSTPPRYLAICRASQAFFLTQSRHLLDTLWIDRESSCLFDSFSTPGGSIEFLFLILTCCSLIPSRHLSCRRALSRHFLYRSFDTSQYLNLSRFTSCSI